MIVGDRDADGITSTAMIADYFLDYGVEPILRLPQGDEAYGLTPMVVQEAFNTGVTLIICVDNGSSAYEAVALAKKFSIDVIIFDHHDIGENPLDVTAFINPKRNDRYQNQQLSASAVVLKALFALDFSMTGAFNRYDVLLYASELGENHYQVIALEVVNLEIRSVLPITLNGSSSDRLDSEREKIIQFVEGREIFIYGGKEQAKLLSLALGVDVFAHDMQEQLQNLYPGLAQYSLIELIKKSKFFSYKEHPQLRDALLLLYRLLLTSDVEKLKHYYQGFSLATIGLLADLAPVLGENRIIIQRGLDALNSGVNVKVSRLLSHLHLLNTALTTNELNWKFIPLINASGRMGQPDIALRALLSADIKEQEELAQELVQLNGQRRNLTMQWWESLQSGMKASFKQYQRQAVFVCEKDLPRGLTGLIAGRISRVYDCFALVIAIKSNETASASMRSPYDFHVAPFIEHCKDLFIDAGGHAQAGGFTIAVEYLPELQVRLKTFVEKLIVDTRVVKKELQREFHYDAKLPHEYFNERAISVVERLAPYGSRFEQLVFYVPSVRLESATLIGKQEEHLKLGVMIGSAHWNCLFWDASSRFAELEIGISLDILCKIRKESGRYQGFQLDLIDFREAKSDE
nr:DHH family phosphoesterase [Entomospira entomophilus]